ncbi:M15 family metallopeptidase [Nocardioides caldifontis]|uniref:M15 family metallopeptidase n=1 Tax=Nocardioides caldifontis TaxID=2588938 RepID=UPI0011DFF639|nr:M15 family metallopeptidase [Nocardioides caldifontis]
MARTPLRPVAGRSLVRALPVPLLTLAVLLAVVLAVVPANPASAAVATTLEVAVPARAVVDTEVTARAVLLRQDTGEPVADAQVRLERRSGGQWSRIGAGRTDGQGVVTATFRVEPAAADNAVRAVYAGSAELSPVTSEVATVRPRVRTTRLTVSGPAKVVDEKVVRLTFRWRAGNGDPVPGRAVVQVRQGKAGWKRHERITFAADGTASVRVAPRVDTRWRAVGKAGRWWAGDTSPVHRLDNVPPLSPVRYPKAAPKPRVKLPSQKRAVGSGANARVSRLSGKVWRSMKGRSWHRGCPVGRGKLRLVQVNYWGYDGYRHRGELVVNAAIAGKTAGVFTALYRDQRRIRAMYRVDRFGWSKRVRGADDYRSMAAGNTSAFNCRDVVGRPGVRSPHSYGRAIDINPWENPYRASHGWVPNQWWVGRSHPDLAWRSSSHPMVLLMRSHGFRWTYGTGDAHHFDG